MQMNQKDKIKIKKNIKTKLLSKIKIKGLKLILDVNEDTRKHVRTSVHHRKKNVRRKE